MFNKLIKRGQRKVSKAEPIEPPSSNYPPPSVIVNHASRTSVGPPSSAPNSQPLSMVAPPNSGVVEVLPMLKDSPPQDRHVLFLRKLQICCFSFDFSDTLKSVREKEIKRQTILELIDLVQSGTCKLNETLQEELIRMISVNIFRCLPPASHENSGTEAGDPEEDDVYLEPSWIHLQLIYELLFSYVVSNETDTKVAMRYIDHSFVLKLLDLFDSRIREANLLKKIISWQILLLGVIEVLAVTNCGKEVLFLGELEEVLEATQPPEFQRCMVPLFRQIGRCLNSSHFQVAERALFLWNNEHVVSLIVQNRQVILPLIYEALEKNMRGH
ncbi:Serine/threonine protein phosphatase 2A 57 kDa regulatory subunit B' alpha isoform [Camellia lanceoleosa]|uniref:Serine/threonine protein phosphatase 2A 57 kDa regulatory subunit B' alpha isoform n=1 Tax=Camellia lanceoleosa TaxID=1840588 RepID=A0ACC0IU80_9ERIC|nr:Serine/threonine protein phosphatase 2A 57 kDa regulatory subunit B' alpha isoform [Camellia lanceoleosa]